MMAGVLMLTALALARGQQVVALALAALATVSVTAIAHPQPYRMFAIAALLAFPLVNATPQLRPQDYDYLIYIGAFCLLLVGLGIYQAAPIPARLGTAYLGYILLAASITRIHDLGIQDGIRALSPLVAAFAVYVLVLRSDRMERRLLIGLLLLLASIESVIAILQVLTGWPVFSVVLPTLFSENRNYLAYFIPGMSSSVTLGSGTFYHFNLLGSILAMATTIAFGLWLEAPRRWWTFALFALLASGTVATFSRGALLAVTLGILILLFSEYRRGRRQASIVIVSAVAVAAMLALNVATRYVEATGNISARESTWRFAVNDALERPSNLFFGYGFQHFQSAVLSAGDVNRAIYTNVLTLLHSGSLQLALEFGLVGLGLFLLWIFTVVRDSRPCFESFLVRSLVAATMAFFAYQVVENILIGYPGVLFVAVVACLEAECASIKAAVQEAP